MRRLIHICPFSLLWLAIVLLSSCTDIIEPSLSNKTEVLEAPADGYQSTSAGLSFWWDGVDHALKYHLQVVSGSFASPNALVLDTLSALTKFGATLAPGSYQWRVQAVNGSTQTAYSAPRSFTVVYSSIKGQRVQLTGPAANLLTSQSSLTFSWGSLYGATRYRLELDTASFADESKVVVNQLTPGQQLTLTLSKDQSYQWRVRAENDTAQSQWSAIGYFSYDHTPPPVPVLTSPGKGAAVSLPVTLQWGASATAVKYRLQAFGSDSTTVYNSTFPLLQSGTAYSFTKGILGDQVYWSVSAIDAAGNESKPSPKRSFTVQ